MVHYLANKETGKEVTVAMGCNYPEEQLTCSGNCGECSYSIAKFSDGRTMTIPEALEVIKAEGLKY